MTWRWLLADGARPEPGAREALEAAAAARPDARLVGSRLLGSGAQPWPELFAKDRAIAAARDRLLAVRALPACSLLVRGDVLAEHGEPPLRPWGADLAWSAAVLRDGGGYLAPRSVVRRAEWVAAGGRMALLRGRARLVVVPGLTPPERLWLTFLLARAAMEHRA